MPALIFALGMYLPLELNTPALVGGFLVALPEQAAARPARERGVIIASGLMAGGALGGVFGAACRLIPGYTEEWIQTPFYDNDPISQTPLGGPVRRRCAGMSGGDRRRGSRLERGRVRDEIQHVVFAQLRDDGFHELGPEAFPRALLHVVHLPHQVAGRPAGNTRNGSEALQIRAVAGAARFGERLALS